MKSFFLRSNFLFSFSLSPTEIFQGYNIIRMDSQRKTAGPRHKNVSWEEHSERINDNNKKQTNKQKHKNKNKIKNK